MTDSHFLQMTKTKFKSKYALKMNMLVNVDCVVILLKRFKNSYCVDTDLATAALGTEQLI